MKLGRMCYCGWLALFLSMASLLGANPQIAESSLTEEGRRIEARYAKELEGLRSQITKRIPFVPVPTTEEARKKEFDFPEVELGGKKKSGDSSLEELLGDGKQPDPQVEESDPQKSFASFMLSDKLDALLVKYVVLLDASPRGLAEYAQQGKEHQRRVEHLLADVALMKRMLVADGAKAKRNGRTYGPARYGKAMEIYTAIRKASSKASGGILERLALAIALEHAVPMVQTNPKNQENAPATIDPIKRYFHYEKGYLAGELDPTFKGLSVWSLRMVINGDEPDETLAWGRRMLRNFKPDHIYESNFGWRYVGIVSSEVKYGSGDVKYDRPELQKYQNIIMNGGICGRRAFFGRFILRSFGVPTTARPSRGHGALARWTPGGWCVNLGPGWGSGWTATSYHKDVDFLASSKARKDESAFLHVKRAQWIGDVFGEKRVYGENDPSLRFNSLVTLKPNFWNRMALQAQTKIISDLKAVTLEALGAELGESNKPTIAQQILSAPISADDKVIRYGQDGVISIPAAGYTQSSGNPREVLAMKSFEGGMQIFLPRFAPEGLTIMRGGTWKGTPDACTSGVRMLSGGYGRYENWGLRAAITPAPGKVPAKELKLNLGDGVTMEFIYVKPGKFVMGGENEKEGRFACVEVPKHGVELTQGFYLGKYEVTQSQYMAAMGQNPSRSTKGADCPVDNVSEPDAQQFCIRLSEITNVEARLPTEAEWEYASRAGGSSKWFFGDDPSKIGDYAWYKDNAGAKSHPVGQKKPNPWGFYDIYGNVCERIADKYHKAYYSESPAKDPTGPKQATKSLFEYTIAAPEAGQYTLSAQVVTVNYDQWLKVSANEGSEVAMPMPFTEGEWQNSKPVTVTLIKGENTLRFWRDAPPQKGVAVKKFTLEPAN
jgi:formylglycine-generating enzyme required for sulfatase activity